MFLLLGAKFMPEIHLRHPRFTYSACGPITRNKEKIRTKRKKKQLIQDNYRNELHKSCFKYDMGDGDFKDLNRRMVADKVLPDKAFNIAKNSKCNGQQRGLQVFLIKRLLTEQLKMKLSLT